LFSFFLKTVSVTFSAKFSHAPDAKKHQLSDPLDTDGYSKSLAKLRRTPSSRSNLAKAFAVLLSV